MWYCNQPSIHCLIVQVKILFVAFKFLGGLAPIYLYHLTTFGSFHSPAIISLIYVYISFAHDSTQYSYSSFNLQTQPLISQKTCLDSPAWV